MPFQKIRVAAFMHEAQKINHIAPDGIVNVKWKWARTSTGETMRPNMVTAFPADNLACLSGDPLPDDELEQAVDDLVKLTRRYPFQPLYQNVMRAVALGGAVLLGADKDVSDEEVKILVQILHRWFTDEPEAEIVTDRDVVQARLPDVLAKVREEGSPDDRTFILSRLTDVAMADGALMDAESAVILDVARQLDVPAKTAYAIMVGAAQATGFRTDVKLNRMAEEIRRSMMLGLKG